MIQVKILMVLLVLSVAMAAKSKPQSGKIDPLAPIKGRVISEFVSEPSGMSLCSSTQTLFVICDTGSCGAVYELDRNGTLLQTWRFPERLKDIESVACDDQNQRLFVAEEGLMRVSVFVLPVRSDNRTFTSQLEDLFLVRLDSFDVDLDVRPS